MQPTSLRVRRTISKLFLVALLMLPGCLLGPDERPASAVEFTLYDQPVTCENGAATCRDASGQLVSGEYHRVRTDARLWRSGAQASLRLRLSLQRPRGERGVLSLAVPLGTSASVAARPAPVLSYSESFGGTTTFVGEHVAGRLEVSVDPSCACQVGRFELVFIDPGADGLRGTADDRVRRLGAGRLRLDARPFCHGRSALTVKDDVLVIGARACPASARGKGTTGLGAGSCAWGFGAAGGWLDDGWNDDGWYEDDWLSDWDAGSKDYDDGGSWEDDRGWDDGWDGWSGYEEQVPTGYDTPAGCSDCGGGSAGGWDDGWDDWGGGGWDSGGDDGWDSGSGGGSWEESWTEESDSGSDDDWGDDWGSDDDWDDWDDDWDDEW